MPRVETSFVFWLQNNMRNIMREARNGSQYATRRRIYATRWRKWIFVEWHLFVIRQLCRMTKRLRGRKRVISPELITRTFPEIETTYLSTYIPYLLRMQTATLAISRVTMGAISNRQSLGIVYLHLHKLRTTRIYSLLGKNFAIV